MAAFVAAIQRPDLDDASDEDLTCTVTTDEGDLYVLDDSKGI